jgi:hypothetical protein
MAEDMRRVLELQQQANEFQNLLHEQMIRSAASIEQCPACKQYYSRIAGHECKLPERGKNP